MKPVVCRRARGIHVCSASSNYKLLIVTFKALRTGTPGYLSDLLEKQTITRRTRSQSSDAPDRLAVPLYSGERSAGTSYSVAAPKLWNSLPANIRNSRSLIRHFQETLKNSLFQRTFLWNINIVILSYIMCTIYHLIQL